MSNVGIKHSWWVRRGFGVAMIAEGLVRLLTPWSPRWNLRFAIWATKRVSRKIHADDPGYWSRIAAAKSQEEE